MKRFISFLLRKIPRKYLQLFVKPAMLVLGLRYRGDKVQCPICEKKYREFLPYGRTNPRQNALCPSCLSLERHRLIWLYMKEQTDFFLSPKHILHVAPEPCFMHRMEKIHGEQYITADIESPLAKVKMDIHNIPFESNTFDVALCNHVLEHVEDDLLAMKELHRVLKPGGWAIMQVPFFHPIPEKTFEDKTITDPKEREKIFGQDDHVRKFGKDYAERLSHAGFDVKEEEFVKSITAEKVFYHGLPKNEVIFFCMKK